MAAPSVVEDGAGPAGLADGGTAVLTEPEPSEAPAASVPAFRDPSTGTAEPAATAGGAADANGARHTSPAVESGSRSTASEDPAPTSPSAPVEASTAPSAPVGNRDLASVRRAWKGILEEGSRIPAGTGFFLRAADLALADGGATVRIVLPANAPMLEPLSDARRRAPLEQALASRLGGPVRIEIVAGEAGPAPAAERRITAEGARQERLRRMAAEEPLLEAAVREWDLELLD